MRRSIADLSMLGRSAIKTVEVCTARGLVTATTVGSGWLRPGAHRALASGARWARAIEAARRCDGNRLSSPVSALNPAVQAPEWPGRFTGPLAVLVEASDPFDRRPARRVLPRDERARQTRETS